MSKAIAFLIVLSLIATPQAFARAQTAAYAEVAAIDAQKFPEISALVDVYDANGQFMGGLQPSDLTVYEDGQQRDSLRRIRSVSDEAHVGAHVTYGLPWRTFNELPTPFADGFASPKRGETQVELGVFRVQLVQRVGVAAVVPPNVLDD